MLDLTLDDRPAAAEPVHYIKAPGRYSEERARYEFDPVAWLAQRMSRVMVTDLVLWDVHVPQRVTVVASPLCESLPPPDYIDDPDASFVIHRRRPPCIDLGCPESFVRPGTAIGAHRHPMPSVPSVRRMSLVDVSMVWSAPTRTPWLWALQGLLACFPNLEELRLVDTRGTAAITSSFGTLKLRDVLGPRPPRPLRSVITAGALFEGIHGVQDIRAEQSRHDMTKRSTKMMKTRERMFKVSEARRRDGAAFKQC